MSLNHHILAKTTTDEVLDRFKRTEWQCANGIGKDFYRVGTSADFPSPDAAFYDEANNVLVSFEFKPTTESKRGILTGIGQSIAYLQSSNISYLISPVMLEDFHIGNYLIDLYAKQISDRIPIGLILYENNNPTNVIMAQNVESIEFPKGKRGSLKTSRFWAKHQDLPVPLFHVILHYYYLKKAQMIQGDPYAECWLNHMLSPTVLEDFQIKPVCDLSGKPIMTLAGTKQITFLEKAIPKLKGTPSEKKARLAKIIDCTYNGDNLFNSVKKNHISFIRGMQMIDSENCLTESGFRLYYLGLIHGATSKIFTDYFTKELLTTGHHLDLILDFDTVKQNNTKADISEILKEMETRYEEKGYIKRNPKRQSAEISRVDFLKYERILWNALDLVKNNGTIHWRRITEICSLPDL
jgi:hypothetical protein